MGNFQTAETRSYKTIREQNIINNNIKMQQKSVGMSYDLGLQRM